MPTAIPLRLLVLPASDGPLTVSASNLRQQRRLWLVLGCPDLVHQNKRERIRDFKAVFDALTQTFQERAVAQRETLLREHQVPVPRVQRMEATLADEQNQSRPIAPSSRRRGKRLEWSGGSGRLFSVV